MHGKLNRRVCPPGWRNIARELHVDPLDTAAVVDAMTRDLASRMRMRDAELNALDAMDALEAATTPHRADPPTPPPHPHRSRVEAIVLAGLTTPGNDLSPNPTRPSDPAAVIVTEAHDSALTSDQGADGRARDLRGDGPRAGD